MIGDLLYQFAEWLRTTWITDLATWLENTMLSQWIVNHFWAIPTIQVFHISALAALFGSALMINLKILGIGGSGFNYADTAKRFVPWMNWGFVVLLISGLGLIVGEPIRELPNPIFWLKMALIVITLPISLIFNAQVAKVEATGRLSATGSLPAHYKIGAFLLIALWCAIMFGGRWIAYAPV
jgi:hypothetical protein